MRQMLSPLEGEVVLLKATWDLIGEAANATVFKVTGIDPDSQIRFDSSLHQKFFSIVLVDFLSETDRDAPLKSETLLAGLRKVAATPLLSLPSSTAELALAVEDFASWLEQEVQVEAWLPSIDKQITFALTRSKFIRICGNLSKHSFLRTFRVAKELRALLAAAGESTSLEEASLALDDFYERFHTDILNYHSSTIAEFLNNIRWGVYQYLRPEFERSFAWDATNPTLHGYDIPEGLHSAYARTAYWDLMNEVMTQPSMRRFKVTRWLKLRY